MVNSRIKDQAFWEKVKQAVEAGRARGESSGSIVKQFGVSAGGWTYAKGRFGWGKQYKYPKGAKAKAAGSFIEYKAADSTDNLITVQLGEIKVTVRNIDTLKSIIAVMQEISK